MSDRRIPEFKYHPDPIGTGEFKILAEPEMCDCCEKLTNITYDGPFYSEEEISCLCPECIKNGNAAKMFDGEFHDSESIDEGVEDEEKLDELIHRTPGYSGIQQEYWRVHCGDFCAFVGHVGSKELNEMKIIEEVLDGENLIDDIEEIIRTRLEKEGWYQGYLFKCLHCGKYRLHWDYD